MVSPSIPNGIYQFIKISPNKLPMLSNKNHCDPKKQRDPKSSAIQKAARSKKQRDQMYYKLSSAQKSGTPPNSIVNKKSKATHQSDYIQSPPPSSYYQPITFNCKSTPISTIFVTREIHFVPILSSSSSLTRVCKFVHSQNRDETWD